MEFEMNTKRDHSTKIEAASAAHPNLRQDATMGGDGPIVLNEREISAIIERPKVIEAIERAFVKFSQGQIVVPPAGVFDPEGGHVVIKSALESGEDYAIKTASYFAANTQAGIAAIQGMVTLFDAKSGKPKAILIDNATLTHHRTGAAGAVAAKWMSREDSSRVLIFGCGQQARYQLDYLTEVRPIEKVGVRALNYILGQAYIDQMSAKHPKMEFELIEDSEDHLDHAFKQADIIITATPSQRPLIRASMLHKGTHINAMGSDQVGKRELASEVITSSLYVADSTAQCAKVGELQHLVKILRPSALERIVYAEIGEIVAGKKAGRPYRDSIMVFDSTGLGAQDLAIAQYIYQAAHAEGS